MTTIKKKKKNRNKENKINKRGKKMREGNKDVSDLNLLCTKIAMILKTFLYLVREKAVFSSDC